MRSIFLLNISSFLFLLPQAVSMGELYGEINKLTMEWRDGLMAITVRVCVQVRTAIIVYVNLGSKVDLSKLDSVVNKLKI